MKDKLKSNRAIVGIVGTGYVGLPLAQIFSRNLKVIGYDINEDKIKKLTNDNSNPNLFFTTNPGDLSQVDFIIICVPTPATKSKKPDLRPIKEAARTISQNMKKNCIVILESTVYPGVTEDVVKPILEESGLKCGRDFKIAHCPERINPGDDEHTIDKVTKVVAGMDEETTETVSELYRKVSSKIFKAKDIRTAEAEKIVENIQRDLNIALMNELSLIFEKLGMSTKDVLEAASTKWNFHRYSPGLVGGHCIPVVPYYLVHKAKEAGYHSQLILSGRAVNDYMPKHVAEMAIEALKNTGKVIKDSKILIMGLTYKEDVADAGETPAREIVNELKKYGVEVLAYEPLLDEKGNDFGIKVVSKFKQIPKVDGVILTVAHKAFKEITLDKLKINMNKKPILIDVRGFFDGKEAVKKGFYYRTL
ncbi:MAG: nucleotide sugar dehydrogenase [Chloroflexota bacterium]